MKGSSLALAPNESKTCCISAGGIFNKSWIETLLSLRVETKFLT